MRGSEVMPEDDRGEVVYPRWPRGCLKVVYGARTRGIFCFTCSIFCVRIIVCIGEFEDPMTSTFGSEG